MYFVSLIISIGIHCLHAITTHGGPLCTVLNQSVDIHRFALNLNKTQTQKGALTFLNLLTRAQHITLPDFYICRQGYEQGYLNFPIRMEKCDLFSSSWSI